MKKSIITELFNGNRGHIETMTMPKEHFDYSVKEVADAYEKMLEKLTPEQVDYLHKFERANLKSQSEEVDFYFCEGFKLGLLIGIEASDT